MPLPALVRGLIVQREYYWKDPSTGPRSGDKPRPCLVLQVTNSKEGNVGKEVYYLPITHSPQPPPSIAIEIPPAVRAVAGLDPIRQWVVTNEFNSEEWPHGLAPILRPKDPQIPTQYGHFPPDFYEMVKASAAENQKNKDFKRGRQPPPPPLVSVSKP